MVGGVDSNGTAHDDAWSVSLPRGGAAWSSARLVRGDSGRPDLVGSPTSVVIASAEGDDLHAWSVADDNGAGVITALERTARGWTEVDERGVLVSTECAEDDPHGGELCKLDSAWWATPGVLPCASEPDAGVCRGTVGVLEADTKLRAGAKVVSAVPDGRLLGLGPHTQHAGAVVDRR